MLQPDFDEVLKKARNTYGDKAQILICIEELNELACVLAKYPRYEDHAEALKDLHNKAVEEVADVEIILNHVKAILEIQDEELQNMIGRKICRLQHWLETSDSQTQTIKDRVY